MHFESNDDFAQLVQMRYAIPLYREYWNVESDDITEVDQQNRDGDALAELLDMDGGVDKIINLGGVLLIAQRIRRPRPKRYRDLTIRRQVEQDWNAEYTKLKRCYNGQGSNPSKYAYMEVTETVENEIEKRLNQKDSYKDVDLTSIETPTEDAIQEFHIFDLDGFLEMEFAGDLAKKKSPQHHNRTDDPYYWENSNAHDNGFYVWDWNELRMKGLIEAEYEDGEWVDRTNGERNALQSRPENPHDITNWADD